MTHLRPYCIPLYPLPQQGIAWHPTSHHNIHPFTAPYPLLSSSEAAGLKLVTPLLPHMLSTDQAKSCPLSGPPVQQL